MPSVGEQKHPQLSHAVRTPKVVRFELLACGCRAQNLCVWLSHRNAMSNPRHGVATTPAEPRRRSPSVSKNCSSGAPAIRSTRWRHGNEYLFHSPRVAPCRFTCMNGGGASLSAKFCRSALTRVGPRMMNAIQLTLRKQCPKHDRIHEDRAEDPSP